jgi:1,4-dihydroxy-6-naphthoate synthase
MKKLTIAFSPCPNDTLMFDALVHNKINAAGFSFEYVLADIEELNRKAMENRYDITKLSFPAFAKMQSEYQLLTSGSALGKNAGPVLVTKGDPKTFFKSVGIPGINTTAYYLFKTFFKENFQVKEMVFSQIEDAVLNEKVDAGLLIHENRFTYSGKGLKKIADMGELWEEKYHLPIPLGGIAIRRSLPENIKVQINRLVRESVEYAFANPDASTEFVRKNSQEMDEEVCRKHIALYVNNFSADLGQEGQKAIRIFLKELGLEREDLFVSKD